MGEAVRLLVGLDVGVPVGFVVGLAVGAAVGLAAGLALGACCRRTSRWRCSRDYVSDSPFTSGLTVELIVGAPVVVALKLDCHSDSMVKHPDSALEFVRTLCWSCHQAGKQTERGAAAI